MKLVRSVAAFLGRHFILLALALLIAFFGIAAENFLSAATLTAVLNQLPALTVVTIGMTFVLIVAGIDLSVGSILGLSATVIGLLVVGFDLPLWAACAAGIGAGLACGLINGLLVSRFGLPAFIVTLGMLEMARGMAYVTSDSQTQYIGTSIQGLALPIAGLGVSPALLAAVALVVAGQFVLTRTVLGRYLMAIGSNADAARMAGIDSRPFRLFVLVLSGTLAGLAGVFNAAYLGSADPNAGIGLELSAIAAAVIGGTSLMGGRGSIAGAFAGVLIISILQSGLAQIGVTEPTKRLVTGAVIVIAVLIDRWRVRHDA